MCSLKKEYDNQYSVYYSFKIMLVDWLWMKVDDMLILMLIKCKENIWKVTNDRYCIFSKSISWFDETILDVFSFLNSLTVCPT